MFTLWDCIPGMKAPAAVAPHRPDVFSTPHQLMTNHHLHITIGHQAVMIKIMNKIMIILVIWWCEWCWIDRRGLANGLFTSSPRTMASATTYTYYYHHCYRYQNHAKLREAINIEKKDFWGNHFIKWWQAPPPRPPFMKSLFILFPSIFWSKKMRWFWRLFEGCWWVF